MITKIKFALFILIIIFNDHPQHVLKYFPFTPNPLQGAFKVCAFDGCAKAKSPLGETTFGGAN
jgi:hypothetical protein